MVQINRKRFVLGCLIPVLLLIIYWTVSIRPDMTTFINSRMDSNASLSTMEDLRCNFNFSNGSNADEFSHAMKRHNDKKGRGTMKTYPVSDSYETFGINDSLSCWEESKFKETWDENRQFIQNYPCGDSNPYLQNFGLAGKFIDFPNPKIPVFVTAASSNHFLEVQAQMQSLHNVVFPYYKDLKYIFYDIGLNQTEKDLVKKYCRCEYRSFPFDKYPEHVKVLKGYTFKPLITQAVLNEYGFVMWMDASVRVRTGKLDTLFEMVIKDEVKITEGGLGVAYRTDPMTFKFLREDPCLFADKNEIQATYFLLYRTRFTLETIMRPWVSCALTSGCMFFPGSQKRISCVNQKGLGFCHRFDQSILSIILWRLYHADFKKVLIAGDFFDVRRDHTTKYFESLEKKSNLHPVQT